MLTDSAKLKFSGLWAAFSCGYIWWIEETNWPKAHLVTITLSDLAVMFMAMGLHELGSNPRYRMSDITNHNLIIRLNQMCKIAFVIMCSVALSGVASIISLIISGTRDAMVYLTMPMFYHVLWLYIPFEYVTKTRKPKLQRTIYYPMMIE